MTAIARAKGIDLGRTPWFDPADLEAWFGDEARIGQKNKITRRWARRGTRRWAPQDQRTASTCILGAICPKEAQASPHFQIAPNISRKTGCAASSWANCPISGCRRWCGMVGMSS